MDIAISTIPTSVSAVRDIAITAERHGIRRLGIADSPHLFGAAYPAVQHVLAVTQRLQVGPFVTNPVTIHSSVHAANLAALLELHPGRVSVALGAGDSAVRSAGLAMATREELRAALRSIREVVGDRLIIELAVSGPRAADAVPPEADGVVLGSGLSVPYTRLLRERAEAAAGKRLSSRIVLVSRLHEAEIHTGAAQEVRASALAYARHGVGPDLAARDVPAPLRDGLRAVLDGYDVSAHARVGGRNAELLDRHPEVAEYLVQRFALVGRPQDAAARLMDFARQTGVDGVSLSVNVADPISQVTLIGGDLLPRIARAGRSDEQAATETEKR